MKIKDKESGKENTTLITLGSDLLIPGTPAPS